jgi:hypothetical protein
MKKLLLTLALAAVATYTYAQGTIQFANGASSRFRINGVVPVNATLGGPAGGTFSFGVYVGTTADALSATPVTPLGTNTGVGGIISGANANAYAVTGEPNTTVFIQIRGWESRFPTWQEGQQGLHGQTAVRAVVLGRPQGRPFCFALFMSHPPSNDAAERDLASKWAIGSSLFLGRPSRRPTVRRAGGLAHEMRVPSPLAAGPKSRRDEKILALRRIG